MNGKDTEVYSKWRTMIERCYGSKIHLSRPTYAGCTITDEWRDFQDFADWFVSHDYSGYGYQLDKDILIPNNKIYSPDTCCFVPQELNILFTNTRPSRDNCPQGVYFRKEYSRYTAQLAVDGGTKHLGSFGCSNEAHLAYMVAKKAYIKVKALEWQDRIADNVFEALMAWSSQPQLPNLDAKLIK